MSKNIFDELDWRLCFQAKTFNLYLKRTYALEQDNQMMDYLQVFVISKVSLFIEMKPTNSSFNDKRNVHKL